MFRKNQDLPSPKPDPPRVFSWDLIVQFIVCMLTLSFCGFTLDVMDKTFRHEETKQQYDFTEMVISCPDK